MTAYIIPRHARRLVVSVRVMNQMPVWIPTHTATILLLANGMAMLVSRPVDSVETLRLWTQAALMN